MSFNALLMTEGEDGVVCAVTELTEDDLPEGDVLVDVEFSTLNYKDGMILNGNIGRLVRSFPHVPGVDFAGTVEHSSDPRYKAGDKVVLTGWRVGEAHWGGFAQKAQVRADWLVPLPEGLTTKQAMAVGTAGFAAVFAVLALEDHGLAPEKGPVLVTGATGGVGSVAVAMLAKMGYTVAGSTGQADQADYLRDLGCSEIVTRASLAEPAGRPLESEKWAGCVDAVGGSTLARVLGQMQYRGSVSACGLAAGASMECSVLPFLLRGVNLLGIDTVMQPYENRVRAWQRVAEDLPMEKLEAMTEMCGLADLPENAKRILKGQIRGRLVIDVNV